MHYTNLLILNAYPPDSRILAGCSSKMGNSERKAACTMKKVHAASVLREIRSDDLSSQTVSGCEGEKRRGKGDRYDCTVSQ